METTTPTFTTILVVDHGLCTLLTPFNTLLYLKTLRREFMWIKPNHRDRISLYSACKCWLSVDFNALQFPSTTKIYMGFNCFMFNLVDLALQSEMYALIWYNRFFEIILHFKKSFILLTSLMIKYKLSHRPTFCAFERTQITT